MKPGAKSQYHSPSQQESIMTGYTVHTGSSEKFSQGWDSIFKKRAGKKTAAKKTPKAKAAAKKSAKKKKK